MNRIDRLTAILIHLQSKQIVKAEEIAERFEISKRTVYRDIRALEEAGVPIGAEAGKGYFICEGYYLPPVMFTKKEAVAMLLAGKFIEKLTDEGTTIDYQSALYKIRSVLSTGDKEFISELGDYIDIKLISSFADENKRCNFLGEIQNALVHQKILRIDYSSYYKEEYTKGRLIEPIGLCYYGLSWHLISFCKLRNDYRDFRIDRIQQLTVTEQSYERKERDSMDEYFKNFINSNELIEIIVRFDKKVYDELRTQKYYYGFIQQTELENKVEMVFLNDSFDYIGRWLLRFGNNAEIIKPNGLIHVMKKLASEICEHYL